jgi:NADH dehydrogenase
VADIWKLHFGGFIAWLAWIFVHIFFLIGFRNRVMVMLEWAWSYLTFSRGARLITGEGKYASPIARSAGLPAASTATAPPATTPAVRISASSS